MLELTHDFDFVYQRLFAFFLTVGALLGKGLHRMFAAILVLHN